MTGNRRPRRARIVVVTGMSGSGKSTATKVFEDIGYFCVDNLPPVLLPKIVDLVSEARGDVASIALVADMRGREFLYDFERVIEELRRGQHDVHVLFLDAGDDVLLLRFSETRRRHPLAVRCGAKEAIRREREMLSPLREMADTVLNTSQHTVHQLRDTIVRRFRTSEVSNLQVGIISFGYRYGIPLEADMVVDVRFLPNPNFVSELKHLTGLDPKVREYVMKNRSTRAFFGKLTSFLQFLLPLYTKEGKAYFTLGVGCTGGRHRSVVVTEALKRSLPKPVAPNVVHRDIRRSSPPGRSPH
jgi:UPF0042 nucleotide-binding protein